MGRRSLDSIFSDKSEIADSSLADETPAETKSDDDKPSGEESASETRAGPEPAKASKAETAQQAKPDSKATPKKDADEVEDEPEPTDLTGLKKALHAARGDKRKARKEWQETERRLAELSGRYAAMQEQFQAMQRQGASPVKQEKNPETEFFGNPVAFIGAREKALRQEFESRVATARLEMAEQVMRTMHKDYDEVVSGFRQVAASNGAVLAQFRASPNPAQFAYDYMRAVAQVGDVNSVDELREKIRAEVLAELEASRQPGEQQQTTPSGQRNQQPVTRSIASARGSGAGQPAAYNGRRSLSEILGS